jgi:hypothetical protein
VRLVGAFTRLTPERARAFQTNAAAAQEATAGWGAEILGLDAPQPDLTYIRNSNVARGLLAGKQRVPAVVRVRCGVLGDGSLRLLGSDGRFLGSDPGLTLSDRAREALTAMNVAPNEVLSIPASVRRRHDGNADPEDVVTFRIDEVHVDETTAVQLIMRGSARPETLEVAKRSLSDSEPPPAFAALRPRLLAIEIERELPTTTRVDQSAGPMYMVLTTIRVPAVRTPSAWQYAGRDLKSGLEFTLETSTYRLVGDILTLEVPQSGHPR